MTIIVACEGQLTPVVVVFKVLSGFFFTVGGPDACLQQKLNEDLHAQELQVSSN